MCETPTSISTRDTKQNASASLASRVYINSWQPLLAWPGRGKGGLERAGGRSLGGGGGREGEGGRGTPDGEGGGAERRGGEQAAAEPAGLAGEARVAAPGEREGGGRE